MRVQAVNRPSGLPDQEEPDRSSLRSSGVPGARGGTPSHRLPTLLAALSERLPQGRIAALEHVLEMADGPDDVLVSRFVAAQTAAGLAHQLTEITRVWRAEAPAMTGAALALALATARSHPRPRPAQVVISGPVGASVPARLTSGVAVEVIRSATTSLLIASFAAHGARDVVAEIGRAVDRGVAVDLLLEESTQASAAFAALPSGVQIWHRVGATGVLHAKLIAADRHTALLGSANLTDRALSDNIELGVVLRDPRLVEPLIEHFHWLLIPENNVLRRM
ncbi:DISARM system phospholipase D-like protein DrmC [Streptomyces sp. NPDC056468]|uniref:DISARM system phospholipase D-like protein DrmC n=1 Tax=Streptomyces sp. NPDC056468 TaxID=3345830 RepID=UPI0036B9C4F9